MRDGCLRHSPSDDKNTIVRGRLCNRWLPKTEINCATVICALSSVTIVRSVNTPCTWVDVRPSSLHRQSYLQSGQRPTSKSCCLGATHPLDASRQCLVKGTARQLTLATSENFGEELRSQFTAGSSPVGTSKPLCDAVSNPRRRRKTLIGPRARRWIARARYQSRLTFIMSRFDVNDIPDNRLSEVISRNNHSSIFKKISIPCRISNSRGRKTICGDLEGAMQDSPSFLRPVVRRKSLDN